MVVDHRRRRLRVCYLPFVAGRRAEKQLARFLVLIASRMDGRDRGVARG
jgi:hypothetical protein